MPPSPLRFSGGREPRMETHKRGRSFESGLPVKIKDDDLALFNDMQMRERDNFLLCSNDDFDDSLYFKVNIPVRGESSDLLNVGGEKNDYDWLLTPPETPLFPSLDDEEPTPRNLVSRGRSRAQPITIPTSSMTGHRTSRSSASPHRLSPSPRSGNNLSQSRGRPSSAPHSSPAPVLRPATPSRRPFTPPNKPSTPTPRSSTPTPRRMSTGSGGNISSSARRGASPVKASRGNSASPKLRGWQATFPGFSSEPPPNLRTSLPDRPALRARGSSPASRNGRDSLRSGRHSMSPTASRSVSSSHSNERDCFSSHSKGSVASSCDDDMDLAHSVNMEISASPTLRKNGVFVNSRNSTFSKKPSRTISASSAPKRSFDSALRQMDQRKTPQNMFRPLLSSVPASTFYIGKSNNMHRPMFSRNSSLTTSSNASSEQGANIALDTEGCEHDQNELSAEWEKTPDAEAQEEVFAFDKVDETDDVGDEIRIEKPQNIHGDFVESAETIIESEELEQLNSGLVDVKVTLPSTKFSYSAGDHSDVESSTTMAHCSKCNKVFQIHKAIDGMVDICQDCAEKVGYVIDGIHTAGFAETTLIMSQNSHIHPSVAALIDKPCEESHSGSNVPQAFEICSKSVSSHPQSGAEPAPDCLPGICPIEVATGEREQQIPDKNLDCENEVVSASFNRGGKFQRFHSFGLAFRDNLSHSVDNVKSLDGYVTPETLSSSSSIDLGSSRQFETRIRRQLSSSKIKESIRKGLHSKHRSTEMLLSEISINLREDLATHMDGSAEKFRGSSESLHDDSHGESPLVVEEHVESWENTKYCVSRSLSSGTTIPMEDKISQHESCGEMGASLCELASNTYSAHLENAPASDALTDEDCVSSVHAEGHHSENVRSSTLEDMPAETSNSRPIEEHGIINEGPCRTDIYDVLLQSSSGVLLELEDDCDSLKCSSIENDASQSMINTMDLSNAHPVSQALEEDVSVSGLESNNIEHAHDIHGETITVEGPGGNKARSLTLEEATDTILFCNSIVHDLAFKAATIAMEKEQPPTTEETRRPTVMLLGKSAFEEKDHRRAPSKRTPKPRKVKKKRLGADATLPVAEMESVVKCHDASVVNTGLPNKADSMKPPKLESKCNCTVM
ncbi:hypothetical protein Taro_003462 [Colocasia esculenta]|uniref:Uncharacterized protein n=1 Tax=Colocasia esculenta TaxID=4460 RepID=A0A843TM63_COLES|nr:hypothetical protein [Colocasia esculenta]